MKYNQVEDNVISLKELMKKYPIFFDACILIASKGKDPISTKDWISINEKECSFYNLMEDCIKSGANFYIPNSIFEEVHNPEESIFKYSSCEMRLKLYRKRCDRYAAFERLKNVLNKEGKVLKIDWGEEECKRLGAKYYHLKTEYGISDPDFRFLIMGISKLETETSVGLASNDSGIFRAKDYILKEEHIWRRKVKFFARNKSFNFKKVDNLNDLISFKFSSYKNINS